MDKKRIVIFTTSFLPIMGGLQYELKWLLDSMDELVGNSYRNLELYFFAPNKESLRYTSFKNIKVINLDLQTSSKFYLLPNALKLRKTLKKIKPDLIHCQGAIPDALMVYLNNLVYFKRYKYIVTSHGIDIVVLPEIDYGMRLNPLYNFLTRLVLKNVEKHVLPSTALIDFASNAGTHSSKIEVIPNGVKPRNTKLSNKKLINQLRKEWDIDERKTLSLLCLSSTRPVKNLSRLIEGFAQAQQQIGNLKLFLTCEDKTNKILRSKVSELKLQDDVHFIGPIEGDLKDAYFKVCDVFCLPSLFENFPVSVLEAMDYGEIVLVGEVGGLKDFIVNKYNGIFVRSEDANDIADKIVEIYRSKDLQEKVRENAKKSVKEYYIYNIAKQYLHLYTSV